MSVPSIETPSARQAAMAVLFDWNRTAAATAFDKQLLIAQGAAFGENVAARLVGKQVEEKKRTRKPRRRLHRAPARPLLVPHQRRPVRPLQPPLLFSPSASVSSATISFPTTAKGGRINRNTITGLDQFFNILNFIYFSKGASLKKSLTLLIIKSFCVKVTKIIHVNYKQAVLRRS